MATGRMSTPDRVGPVHRPGVEEGELFDNRRKSEERRGNFLVFWDEARTIGAKEKVYSGLDATDFKGYLEI